MRKLVISMNTTADGFIAGPNGELDWHFENWSPEMSTMLCEQLSEADTILLGRITYCAMANYWPGAEERNDFPREDIAYAEMMNRYQKIVFSNTLINADWHNSTVISRQPREKLKKLKSEPGKDMIVYGSGELVSSLLKWNMIDEFRLWVHPVLLGGGRPLVDDRSSGLPMELTGTTALKSGVVLLRYVR